MAQGRPVDGELFWLGAEEVLDWRASGETLKNERKGERERTRGKAT